MARDRNRLCIEDPFEISYNVARTVTKDGLYTIRGEFMRATRILTQRPDRAVLALAELCRERDDDLNRAPRSESPVPRSMSANRGPFAPQTQPTPATWRSQSQAPFDRLGGPHHDSPGGGRGRKPPKDADAEYSAQDLWLAGQGANLGGVGNLGLHTFDVRGRDPQSRGLETPGGPRGGRRAVSAFDEGAGSGSISAPLSPQRLYAQLEMGKGPQLQPNWPPSLMNYDPRLHATQGMPVHATSSHRVPSGRSASRVPSAATSPVAVSDKVVGAAMEPPSPLPVFAPFSPPTHTAGLSLGDAASFISPSTLLSPQKEDRQLPPVSSASANATANTVDNLANSFDKMGVSAPGKGAENPADARKEEANKPVEGKAEGNKGPSRPPGKKATL